MLNNSSWWSSYVYIFRISPTLIHHVGCKSVLCRHSAFLDAKQHNYVLTSLLCDMTIKKQICKSALCSLFVVGRSRLGNVLRIIRGQISLSQCELGKHLSRPNRVPMRQVIIDLEHIEIFTGKSSYHSRNQNPNENNCLALYPSPNYANKE